MDYFEIANSLPLWIAALIPILIILFQAAIFTRKAIDTGKKMGIQNKEFKKVAKVSTIASIGPSIAVMAGMVALLTSVGGPLGWLSAAMIGNISADMTSATIASEVMGCQLGTANMTVEALANVAWVMTIAAGGWTLVATIMTPRMEKIKKKMVKSDEGNGKKFLPVFSAAAALGAYSYLTSGYIISEKNTIPIEGEMIATVIGFAAMFLIASYNKKAKKTWIRDWGITIAMFIGMAAGVLV
nr:DUF5058 family protein [uncultured Faecalimonas sp.]